MSIIRRVRISYRGLQLWLRINKGVRMRLSIGIDFSLPFFGSPFNNPLGMKTEHEEHSPTRGGILKVSKICGSVLPRQNQSDSKLDQSSRGMDQARVGHCLVLFPFPRNHLFWAIVLSVVLRPTSLAFMTSTTSLGRATAWFLVSKAYKIGVVSAGFLRGTESAVVFLVSASFK